MKYLSIFLLFIAILHVSIVASSTESETCSSGTAGACNSKTSPILDSPSEQLFSGYVTLYEQVQMLRDNIRMKAYYSAIMLNKEVFRDKVVLDVGAGSGILSLWAAQAGAKKVYAVEFTDMAKHARKVIDAHGMSNIVEVIQGEAADLKLTEKVDILISEWMGMFLLRESMLDVVLKARDMWLKPEGLMFPSHATMYLGAVIDEEGREENKQNSFDAYMEEWEDFEKNIKKFYNADYEVLKAAYEEESRVFSVTGQWVQLEKEHIVGKPVIVKEFDLHKCTLEDAKGVPPTPFEIVFDAKELPVTVSAYAGWFTVDFNGTDATPLPNPVQLSTHPDQGPQHWAQTVSYLKEALHNAIQKKMIGVFEMIRQPQNWRLYDVKISSQFGAWESPKVSNHTFSIKSFSQ